MALTVRGKRTAYDNIAAGSATGRELTIAGNTVSKQERYGGGYNVSTSNYEHAITKIVADTVSASDAAVQGPENMTAAVDPTDENTGSSNTAGAVTNA